MIASDLYIAIQAARLGEAEAMVLGVTLAQCYGPRKRPSAKLSPSEIARATGLDKSNIHRATLSLVGKGMLEKADDGLYRIGKDYESWRRPNGEPMIPAKLVEFAQGFVVKRRTHKQKAVVTKDNAALSPKTTAVVTKDNESKTAALSPKTTNVVTEDNGRCHGRQRLAPAPYMSLSEETPEDRCHAALPCLDAHDAIGREPADSAAPDDDHALGGDGPTGRTHHDSSIKFKPPTSDPKKADLALRVLGLINDHYGDEDSAEAYASAAIKHADAGLSTFAILEAFRRAVAADVPVVRVGKYVANSVRDIDANLAPPPAEARPRTNPPPERPAPENALARRTRELQEGLRKRFAPPTTEGGSHD